MGFWNSLFKNENKETIRPNNDERMARYAKCLYEFEHKVLPKELVLPVGDYYLTKIGRNMLIEVAKPIFDKYYVPIYGPVPYTNDDFETGLYKCAPNGEKAHYYNIQILRFPFKESPEYNLLVHYGFHIYNSTTVEEKSRKMNPVYYTVEYDAMYRCYFLAEYMSPDEKTIRRTSHGKISSDMDEIANQLSALNRYRLE